jgi:hypothetical protein
MWFDSRRGQDFSPLRVVQTGPGAYPATLSSGYRGFSPGVNRAGRKADRSPPSSPEVKNGAAIPSLPIRRHGVVIN